MTDEPPAPVISGEPTEIVEGVYVISDRGVPLVPNVGIVVGSRATLVVDSGMGPRNGETVRRIAEDLSSGRPLLLTVTHFHPEHGFGAQAFEGRATIVYNQSQLEDLLRKGEPYLEMFRTFGDAVAQQLEDVALVEPDVVYDHSADVLLGGTKAELRTWRLAHTRSDQTVFLPERRVLFTGDLVENGAFAIFPWSPPDEVDISGEGWITVLEELERLEPEVVVPGHGEVGGPEVIAVVREYLQLLRDETHRLASEGGSEEEVAGELDRSMRELHPDWAQPEWIASGARYFYQQDRRRA
jgi:glyoxylase-like metal-dependent hydrolase (beta-lactamase superfamily II)